MVISEDFTPAEAGFFGNVQHILRPKLVTVINRLTEQIAIAQADGTLIKWLNRMKRARLLIFDDFGLQPITHHVKLTLLQILEDRYEQGATMICSQLPVGKWYEYLNEPTLADAILDRIIPRAHRLELKGKSRRKNLKDLS